MSATAEALTSRAEQQDARRRWLAGVALAGGWVALATVLQLVRMRGQRPWRALMAEDGRIFLGDALRDPLGSLFDGYNGYFQLLCRLMGSLATIFPLEDAAVFFAVGGAIIASLISVYVYVATASSLEHRWTRALLAVVTVLTPAAVFEISATGLELHWYLLFACFWTLWETSRTSKLRTAADTVVAGLTVWTTPLAALYAPLALRRAFQGRGRGRWIVLSAWGSGVVAQGLYTLTHERPARFSGLYLPDIPVVFIQRAVGGAFVGDQRLPHVWLRIGWVLVGLLVVGIVALSVYGLLVGQGRRLLIFSTGAYAVVLTVASLVVRGTVELRWPPHQATPAGARYFFVPVLLLSAMAIAIADAARDANGRRRWLSLAPAAVVAAVLVANPTPPTARGLAPPWRDSLRVALSECRYKGEELHVNIAPLTDTWFVPVVCDRRRKAG